MIEQPIHLQIANELKQKIELGIYPKNSPLPSENTLSSHYNVSRVTVQKALRLLVKESYIYSVPGKGSFAKVPPKERYTLIFNELDLFDLPQTNKLIGVGIENPSPELIYSLHVHPKKKVIHVKRTIHINDTIVAYDSKYIPYYAGVPIVEVEINYSAFPLLLSNIVSPYEIKRELMVTGISASGEIAEILELQDGEPCIAIEQRFYDSESTPIGLGWLYVRIEYFKIKSKFNPDISNEGK